MKHIIGAISKIIIAFSIPAGVIYALWFRHPTVLNGGFRLIPEIPYPAIIAFAIVISLWGIIVGFEILLLLTPKQDD